MKHGLAGLEIDVPARLEFCAFVSLTTLACCSLTHAGTVPPLQALALLLFLIMTAATTTSSPTTTTTWHVGQYVHVAPLTIPGFNREGGHGKIVQLHHDGRGHVMAMDVKYTLRRATEKQLGPSDVTPCSTTLERGDRSRRGRDFFMAAAPHSNAAAGENADFPAKKKARKSQHTARTAKNTTCSTDDEEDEVAPTNVPNNNKNNNKKTQQQQKSRNTTANNNKTTTTASTENDRPAVLHRSKTTTNLQATTTTSDNKKKPAVARKPKSRLLPMSSNNNKALQQPPPKATAPTKKSTKPFARPFASTKKTDRPKNMKPKITITSAVLPAGIPKTVIAHGGESTVSPLAFPKHFMTTAVRVVMCVCVCANSISGDAQNELGSTHNKMSVLLLCGCFLHNSKSGKRLVVDY
jgi:hypothetical protein